MHHLHILVLKWILLCHCTQISMNNQLVPYPCIVDRRNEMFDIEPHLQLYIWNIESYSSRWGHNTNHIQQYMAQILWHNLADYSLYHLVLELCSHSYQYITWAHIYIHAAENDSPFKHSYFYHTHHVWAWLRSEMGGFI